MQGGGRSDPTAVLPRLFAQVVEDAPDGVQVTDLQGRIIYSNRATERLYGYTKDEFLGRHVDELNVDPDVAKELIIPSMREHGRWQGELLVKRKDGTPFPISLSTSTVDDGQGHPIAMVGLIRDISAEKRAEDALRERRRLAELSAAVSLALVHDEPLEVVLKLCAEAIVRYLEASLARIWTLHPREPVLELRASAGLHTRIDGTRARVPLGAAKIGIIAKEKKPVLTNNVVEDPHFVDKEWVRREGITSFAGYPLIVEGRVAGVIAMFAKHALTPVALDAIAAMANTLALGIARKTEQLALRASEERFRSVFEEGPLGMAITDAHHRLVRVNGAFERLLGYSSEELSGKMLTDLLHSSADVTEIARLGGVLEGERTRFEAESRFACRGGESVTLRLTSSALHGGPDETRTGLTMVEDVSAQKAAEVALRDAKERAERADRIKSEFLDVASHELRTPLNALALNLQLARTRVRKGAGVGEELIERMLHQVDRMARMVSDLLDASRLDRGKLAIRPEPVDLIKLVSSTVEEFQRQFPRRELRLDAPEGSLMLTADATRIEQVLSNLIDNAFKYCPDSTGVQVTVETSGAKVAVSVADEGPGIPEEHRTRLFTRFFRVKSEIAPDQPGLGLGLYICRVIVELHGGTIDVASELGRGSTFTVTLPTR